LRAARCVLRAACCVLRAACCVEVYRINLNGIIFRPIKV
jgi:hypothetical protein